MNSILTIVHVLACLLLILVVLIQTGRSGGFSGMFGGGGGDALFTSSSQQSGLRKITTAIAIIFFATSFGLTLLNSRQRGQSIFDRQYDAIPGPMNNMPAPEPNVMEDMDSGAASTDAANNQ